VAPAGGSSTDSSAVDPSLVGVPLAPADDATQDGEIDCPDEVPGSDDSSTDPGTGDGTTDPSTDPGTGDGTTDPNTDPGTGDGTTDPGGTPDPDLIGKISWG
jgi:hypothetical protein